MLQKDISIISVVTLPGNIINLTNNNTMEKTTEEFLGILNDLLAKKQNVSTSSIDGWAVYGFHYDRLSTTCPVCGKSNSGWMITYIGRGKEQCCICHRCSSVISKKDIDANELMKSYMFLMDNIDALMTNQALYYCLCERYIDNATYVYYNEIKNNNYGNVLCGKQKQLVRAVNYQFLKLLKDRQPSSNKALHRD